MKDVGRDVSRSMTDLCFLIVFFLFFGFLLALATVAFHTGYPSRILHGVDYNGNVCGEDLSHNPGGSPIVLPPDWGNRHTLWFPLAYDSSARNGFNMDAAVLAAVCVTSCPSIGSTVETYGGGGGSSLPLSYEVKFNSSLVLGRCVPDLATYQCPVWSPTCATLIHSSNVASKVLSAIGVGDFFFGFVSQMAEGWGMIVTMTIVCVIFCFLWLHVLRLIVKPVTIATLVSSVLVLVLIGALAVHQNHVLGNNGEQSDMYTAVAVFGFGGAFLLTCVLLYLWKDILLSCTIIEQATYVINASKFTVLVPVVCSLFIVVAAVFASFIAMSIYTSRAADYRPVSMALANSTATNTSLASLVVVTFLGESWQNVGQFYNVFMFLWIMGIAHAVVYMIASMVAVQWYWHEGGGQAASLKTTPDDAVRWSLWTTIRYHMGTIAFGSFTIALMQLCRILLRLLENRLRHTVGKGQQAAVTVIFCCAECLLACFERIVKFITKQGYIMTAMKGLSLIQGAHLGLKLLVRSPQILTINIVSDVVLTVGKIVIVVVTVLFGYAWMHAHAAYQSQLGDAHENYVVILVLLGLVAYFVASAFASVFSVSIDTILLCYCYDLQENNGQDKPYYAPQELLVAVKDMQQKFPEKREEETLLNK